MKYYEDLTTLLNADAAAYQYFYALSPQLQTILQGRDIRSLEELKTAVGDISVDERPRAF